MTRNKEKWIAMPTITTKEGRRERGVMKVYKGKAPGRRFNPGQFVRHAGELFEIVYAFRVKSNPHEWLYCLEERKSFEAGRIGRALAVATGYGQDTPRVVYDMFRDELDAMKFFADIPIDGSHRITLTNKEMLRVEVVSSGEVLEPGKIERKGG